MRRQNLAPVHRTRRPTNYEVQLPYYHGDDFWADVVVRQSGHPLPTSHKEAALRWVEDAFARLGYPSFVEGLRVRQLDTPDDVRTFDIDVEPVPVFSAREQKPTSEVAP